MMRDGDLTHGDTWMWGRQWCTWVPRSGTLTGGPLACATRCMPPSAVPPLDEDAWVSRLASAGVGLAVGALLGIALCAAHQVVTQKNKNPGCLSGGKTLPTIAELEHSAVRG